MNTKRLRYWRLLSVVLLTLGLALPTLAATASTPFANDAFARAYAAGGLGTKLWGEPLQSRTETYTNAKSGGRAVQYFAKGRMELTYPDAQPDFVGNGKLVVEMVSGRMQVGETLFWQYDGAEIPIAGGKTFGANPGAPSYRAFQSLTSPNPSTVGRPVTAVLASPEDEGFFLGIYSLSSDAALGNLTRNAAYIVETGHNIPDQIWSYLNQTQPNGLPAFNWQTLFGLPITDAYWAKVRNGAALSDVLVQLFERRTVLYNPATGLVENGDVGRDYYRWRYEQPELPVVNDTLSPPETSANARVTPALGEAGTTFQLEASGFQPDEAVDFYARISPDGGVYQGLPFRADGQGRISRRLRTQPLSSPTQELYYTLTGQTSGTVALWHLKIIGSTRYTPAVESVQPDEVPPGQSAALDRPILRVGEVSSLFAGGFLPGESLRAWVTTPLNRVVGWVGLIFSSSTVKDYSPYLRANGDGFIQMEMPAPGSASPGLYAFTLYGTQSRKTAIAYFRVRAGSAAIFNPRWGTFDFDLPDGPPPGASESKAAPPVDITGLTKYRSQYRQPIYNNLTTDDGK